MIWYEDPGQLFTKDNFTHFYPSEGMTLDEKLNAVLRLAVYFAIVMVAIRQNLQYLLVPILVAAGTAGMHVALTRPPPQVTESYRAYDRVEGRECTMPAPQNPFMNVLMTEYADDPERPAACDVGDTGIKEEIQQHFETGLFRNIEDIYGKNASDRQFYTMPSTTIPNDREAFVRFLSEGGPPGPGRRALVCPQQNAATGHDDLRQ